MSRMKKMLCLAAILASFTGLSANPNGYGGQMKLSDMNWKAEFGYVSWRTRRGEHQPFGGTIQRDDLPSDISGFSVDSDSFCVGAKSAEFDCDHGFRLGIGLSPWDNEPWEFFFRYTYFHSDGSKRIGQSESDEDNVWENMIDRSLADNASLNGEFDDGEVDQAQEWLDIKYNAVDLECRGFHQFSKLKCNYFGGLRYACLNFDQDVRYINYEGSNDIDTYDAALRSEMAGWGMRGGCELEYPIFMNGLNIFGRAALSVLVSCFEVSRTDLAYNDTENDVEMRKYRHDFSAMTPNLEAGIGLSYQWNEWWFRAGYEFIHWFNADRQFDYSGWDDVDGNTAQVRITPHDISFDGWFIEAGVSY